MKDSWEYLTATPGQWTGTLLHVVFVRQRDEEGERSGQLGVLG